MKKIIFFAGMRPVGKGIYGVLFLVVLLVFTALKIPAIRLPYFWDEMGVYTRASSYMAQFGPGLLPSSLPPDLSRGHPLLFSFIYGMAYKVFGYNIYTGHILSFAFSVGLLCGIYYMLGKVSNRAVALAAVILIIAQPVFYAQSVLVLPEMMLAFFALFSLYFFYRQRFLLFALFACMAIMTKEAGIVIPVSVLAWAILNRLFNPGNKAYLSLRTIALVCSPLLLFGAFLLVQKHQNGWYFFPLHIGEVSFKYDKIIERLTNAWAFLFEKQGRSPWIWILIAATILLLLKGKFKMPYSFAGLAAVFITVYMCYCVLNFYMDRYLLAVIPLTAMLVIMAVKELWDNIYFLSSALALLVAVSVLQMCPDRFNYDSDMSYQKLLDVEKQAGDYVAANAKPGEQVISSFPMNFVLLLSNTGFNLPRSFTMAGPKPPPEYVVQDNVSGLVGNGDISFDRYTMVKQFTNGFAGESIWKLKKGI